MLEDDYDSEYRYDRAPVGTLQRLAPDRVVYLGTASKTLAPALRLGWALAPAGPRRRRSRGSAGRSTPAAPAITARAYARLIATRRARPAPAPHPPRVPRAPRPAGRGAGKRLHGCRVDGVAAGLHLLLRLPPGTDEDAVVARLAEHRIRVSGLATYALDPHRTSPRW